MVNSFSAYLDVIHLKSDIGLSRARNKGLKQVEGDIIAFPDDDCWYQSDLLERVANLFFYHPEWDGISGISKSGSSNISRWKWDKNPGQINRFNVWQRCRSITIFLKKNVINTVGEFDTSLGLGSGTKWISGEETDYILRALDNHFYIQYCPEIIVNHPDNIPTCNQVEIVKGRGYGYGMGRVLRKHQYPIGFIFMQFILPIGSLFKSLLKGNFTRARYFYHVCIGRIFGWLS